MQISCWTCGPWSVAAGHSQRPDPRAVQSGDTRDGHGGEVPTEEAEKWDVPCCVAQVPVCSCPAIATCKCAAKAQNAAVTLDCNKQLKKHAHNMASNAGSLSILQIPLQFFVRLPISSALCDLPCLHMDVSTIRNADLQGSKVNGEAGRGVAGPGLWFDRTRCPARMMSHTVCTKTRGICASIIPSLFWIVAT